MKRRDFGFATPILITIAIFLFHTSLAFANLIHKKNNHLIYTIKTNYQPIILDGKDLAILQNESINHIQVYTNKNQSQQLITYQIDQRDDDGIYFLDKNKSENTGFDSNDEIVFMPDDAGNQVENPKQFFYTNKSIEIEIINQNTGIKSWVYIVLNKKKNLYKDKAPKDYVHYDSTNDSILTDDYKISFSKEKSFLLNELRWKNTDNDQWSDNYVTHLLLLHRAKIKLINTEFERTGKDYTSTLVGVKDGPIRVIRRTDNKIDILPIIGLKTPSVLIDFISYKNVFYVDTILDFPVPLGWAFKDAITDIQFEWNKQLTKSSIVYTKNYQEGVMINGVLEEEPTLNSLREKEFTIKTPAGNIVASIKKGDSLPIDYGAHITDNANTFGLIGFHTTNWESVSADIHHMLFTLYVIPKEETVSGFAHNVSLNSITQP